MITVYIVGGILLLLFGIGMIRADLIFTWKEEIGLCLRIAGIHFRIAPKKPKKVRLRRYTPRAMEKRRRKEEKKAQKKQKKARKNTEKNGAAPTSSPKESKGDTKERIRLFTAVAETAVRRFGKHLRIRVARLHLAVAAGDAASTALLYTAVSQGIAALAAVLESAGTLRHPVRADTDIRPDFLAEKTAADLKIVFTLRVYQALDLILRSAGTAVRALMQR